MFVKFEKELPGLPHKVGDVAEFPDIVGRSYVEGGYGKETSVSEHMQARQAAMFADLEAKVTRTIQESFKTAPKPPVTRGGVEFNGEVRDGESVTDRRKPNLGDITRFMYWESAYRNQSDEKITEEMAQYAGRHVKAWKLERTSWKDSVESRISASNPHGVARDGAESTQGGAVYGFLVKPEYIGDVFRVESETDVMVGLRQVPVGTSNEAKYPALDQYSTATPTRSSNLFAGVVLSRKPEDVARAEVDAKVSTVDFKVTDLTGMTKLSRDLLADAFIDINGYLQDLFREAFGWRRDWDYINGTGAGEPKGILNAESALTVSRTLASHIRYEDIASMISKMWPACRRGAYWILNAQATSDLQAVQDNATTPRYVYQPNALVSQSMVPSIIGGPGDWAGVLEGFPVKLTEKVPALGTKGDLILFSPRYYGEATRAGLEVGLSEHAFWTTDQVGIRWKRRDDGKSMMRGPIKGADGNSYSNIIVLN